MEGGGSLRRGKCVVLTNIPRINSTLGVGGYLKHVRKFELDVMSKIF